MNPDLQKVMEQRRRKSESKAEDSRNDVAAPAIAPATKKQLSKVSMGQDLQAIMARRRKMAGDASSEEDEIPPAPPQSQGIPDDDAPAKPRSAAKLSTHLDQKGDTGRRKQATDGESTVSGSILSKTGERRSRRKPRGDGDEADDSNERRKMRTRRSKSGDSLSDEVSVDQSVSSRRRRSSDDDTISSGLSSGRRGRRSDDKNLPPTSARSSRQGLGLGNSSDHAGTLASTPETSDKRDKDLQRKKLSSRSSSSGEDEVVTKNTKGRPRPSAGQGVVDSQPKRKSSNTGDSVNSLDSIKKAAVSGWGDFPAFGGADGFESGGVPNDDGFGSFGNFPLSADNADTASGVFDFPLSSNHEESKVDRGKSLSKNDFDVPFSASAFETLPAFSAFDANFPPTDGTGFSASSIVEKTAPQKVWDKSPLKGDLSNRIIARPVLSQELVMSAELHVPPVNNPSNGNFICCTELDGILKIIEIDPSRGNLQVSSTAVMSREFRQKIFSKYNILVHKVENVLALSAGLQRSNGQIRVVVTAILDLFTLESNQVLRVVAVWQWGGGNMHPTALQYTVSPPSTGEFTFEPTTLRNTNGLLFVAGASPKGPCIFISKPSVKETWSANFLGDAGRVSCITAFSSLHRMFPYLVIAMEDGTISLWNYDSALLPLSSKESVAKQRWLFPACRLEASSSFGSEDVGCCTQLEFFASEQSHASLPLLAAAFRNGLAVFHVGLPVLEDKGSELGFKLPDKNAAISLAQVTSIEPVVAKKWEGKKYQKASVAWLYAGPHRGPCLAVLLHGREESANRVVVGNIAFPLYDSAFVTKRANEPLIPFRVLNSLEFDRESDEKPLGFLSGSSFTSFFAFSRKGILQLTLKDPSIQRFKADGMNAALSCPVLSPPCGLSTLGEVLLGDDSELHIFSLLQCERTKAVDGDHVFKWSRPMMRHWLCRAIVGDKKKHQHNVEKVNTAEEVPGGAESDVVCELFHDKLTNYVPTRITRYRGLSVCAIAYRPGLGYPDEGVVDVSSDATLVAFVDWSGANVVVEVLQARDVAFLPSAGAGGVRGLLLSLTGSTLTYFEWDVQKRCCNTKSAYRPVVGVDTNNPKDFLDCRRIFAFEGADKVVLAASATRSRDSKSCIIIGELLEAETISDDNWSSMMPNIETDRSCFFEKHEEIITMVGLENDDNGYRNFAVCTSDRILILTSGLTIAAQSDIAETCSALSPLGAFAIGYIMGNRLCYLCCLDGHLASGSICSFPLSKCQYGLVSIRPDRIVFSDRHSGSHTVELGHSASTFKLHVAKTVPALLLEPMIANAVCVGGKQNVSAPVLRAVIEKFGRKLASITHGENEGIGSFGAGMSARVFEILGRYGLTHASTWLLTGTVQFQRNSNSRVLSPWLSVAQKMKGGFSSDALLHLVSNGDQYYSDYLKSPDHNMTSTLPRQSDPSVYVCRAYAETAMQKGEMVDALKMFDLCGTQSTENILVQLATMRERKNPNSFLRALQGHSDTSLYASSTYASLAVFLSEQQTRQTQMNTDARTRFAKPLAPSLQNGMRVGRARHKLIGETALAEFGQSQIQDPDPSWATPCNEAKHVWNEGPRKQKENLLVLDRIEDWLGRRRPLVLGKEGASAARDRGEKTLADILNQDDNDSFGEKSDIESESDDWVEGVGEGRSDEANLCGYFRMSEGEDANFSWEAEGLQDLSPYKNKLILVGEIDGFSLQESTSSVDEGETGKVKSLYDVVFDLSGVGNASGLALAATRGCSIDVGVLHSSDRQARKKCTVEFWYQVPSALSQGMVLARRTVGPCADDFKQICLASAKDCVLWELVLLENGSLEFRSCGGTVLKSTDNYRPSGPADDGEDIRHNKAVWGRWNHACIVLSSKGLSLSECSVSLYMKGIEVLSSEVSMLPQGYEENDLDSPGTLDDIMQKSHLVFGLNHTAGFRLTDLRIWACERSAEDTQSFMFEYLTAAETKKKFKLKISSKNKGNGSGVGKGAKGGELRQSLFATTKTSGKSSSGLSKGLSLAPPPKATVTTVSPEIEKNVTDGHPSNASFETSFDSFNQPDIAHSTIGSAAKKQSTESTKTAEAAHDDSEAPVTLWDTALPLSKQIRSSAAAALIRGPPATRHFGGNRGGLPDFSGMERFGVGGIAICGSEKTIVWRDNEEPPALTYPIGASGAVVSDQMDDIGSEFLCCFLARERRMIVFELQSKTVVVELQMTTKLNFWRYLPPEAAENTLCFMLVTPVGGFHWMPLEESPRPHQVWKRGPDLQGKKVVSYEEGGSNGLDESDICSKLGLVMVTKESGEGSLESWIIPINGDSHAVQVSDDVLGACFCQPPIIEDGSFLPLLVTVHNLDEGIYVNILSVREPVKGSVELGEIEVSHLIEMDDFKDIDLKPPSLAMGTFPEAICCSLSNIIVVIIRRKGLIAAFELEDDDLSLIAQESVGHYIVDAVMRYSAEVGGAEIVMMLSDTENPKDGRIVSFCFRSAV